MSNMEPRGANPPAALTLEEEQELKTIKDGEAIQTVYSRQDETTAPTKPELQELRVAGESQCPVNTDWTGVKRIEVISAQLGPKSRAFLFVGCFLIAYVYGLDGVRPMFGWWCSRG